MTIPGTITEFLAWIVAVAVASTITSTLTGEDSVYRVRSAGSIHYSLGYRGFLLYLRSISAPALPVILDQNLVIQTVGPYFGF